MRHTLLIAFLVFALAVPGFAAANAPLTFDLTFSNGKITGTFGGVQVQGTYSGTSSSGTWTLTVDGKVFATGTYMCTNSGCKFTATSLAGKATMFSFTSSSLTGNKSGSVTATQFPTHGAWVSAVAHWTDANIKAGERGKVVSEAAKENGKGHTK